MELEFHRQIFGKYSDIKFYEKSIPWETICVPYGQTDRTRMKFFRTEGVEKTQNIFFPKFVSAT